MQNFYPYALAKLDCVCVVTHFLIISSGFFGMLNVFLKSTRDWCSLAGLSEYCSSSSGCNF